MEEEKELGREQRAKRKEPAFSRSLRAVNRQQRADSTYQRTRRRL
jgi:hypothetical protein